MLDSLKRLSSVSRSALAHLCVLAGLTIFAVGAGIIYLPAGLVSGGALLAGYGLFVLPVDPQKGGSR